MGAEWEQTCSVLEVVYKAPDLGQPNVTSGPAVALSTLDHFVACKRLIFAVGCGVALPLCILSSKLTC